MLLKKLKLIAVLDKRTFLLFGESYLYLAWARLLMLRPFSKIAPLLGAKTEETTLHAGKEDLRELKRISQAVSIVSRYTFWDSKCLVKAIAGSKMLERRKLDSTLYLGTAKDEEGKLIAHAWLRSGPLFITGADVMEQFIIVQKFAKKAS
ncbi:lasso peptide biosynthesis B2 protein [Paenibacillus sinopodophylli]|uniref:lasso peptide biosynthesis B2 protein n=1 Tax=Paenibacillus sinopodophylli TaxID=1837342 RepID=UPI0024821E30|nr:lasso peptide biosynthesis B2 protein [Paenibacillus sinopodophylli]